jgi:hypothetical protein
VDLWGDAADDEDEAEAEAEARLAEMSARHKVSEYQS